jgi:DNA-binding transcriptional LysR family regulator
MKRIDIRRLDLNLLKSFDALERHRSVSAAAKALYVGQPAMSHALSRLRRITSDRLFIRTSRGMAPTRRAIAMTEPIRAAMHEIERAFSTSDCASSEQRGGRDGTFESRESS